MPTVAELRPFEYFLVPGRAVLKAAFYVAEVSPSGEYAMLLTIAAAVLSWVCWVIGLKFLLFVTLRLLNLG